MRSAFLMSAALALPGALTAADITSNLLIHLPFDDTPGSSVADNAATTDGSGDADIGASGAVLEASGGIIGGALNFTDNANVFIKDGPLVGLDQGSWTISAWYKGDSSFTRYGKGWRWYNATAATDFSYLDSTHGNDNTVSGAFQVKFPKATEDYDGNGNLHGADYAYLLLKGDAWHHIAISYDATTEQVHLTLDDTVTASMSATLPAAAAAGDAIYLTLGCQSYSGGSNNSWYRGLIDEVRVYSRALDSQDITALYEQGSGGSGPADIQNLTAIAVSHESVQLTWDAVTDADSYTVIRSLDDVFDDTDGDNTVFDNISTNSFTDTGLDADTQYFYQVDAIQN